jgi:hypothetical protein
MTKESNQEKSSALNKETVVGKGGPVAGSTFSIIGAIITLFGFMLPWTSCGSYSYSGVDIFSQSMSGDLSGSEGTFLIFIPMLALIVLGIAITNIPVALIQKIPKIVKLLVAVLVLGLSSITCCPSALFYTNIQSARNDPNSFGLGGMIQLEYGFWVSVMGILLSIFGGLVAVGTSVAHLIMSRKDKSPEDVEVE